MAHPGLDRLRVGALGDGQGNGGVSEVVEPQALKSDISLGRLPVGGVEARRVDWVPCPVREDQPVLAQRGVSGLVLGQEIGHSGGQAYPPAAGLGLGRLADPLAVDPGDLLHDVERAGRQVEPSPAEARQLTPAHAGVGGGVDEGPERRRDGLGEQVHLGRCEEPHLCRRH
ncbi:MAG: hypothetical protein M3066_05520 [Actinomycetota bacterium]|nr:hypothetical protein [Actinomycetota bacterium]